jgi:hypothetical protein
MQSSQSVFVKHNKFSYLIIHFSLYLQELLVKSYEKIYIIYTKTPFTKKFKNAINMSNYFNQFFNFHQGSKSQSSKSFDSSLSPLKSLKNEYTNVIIESKLSNIFQIIMFNKDGKKIFEKSTTINKETKAIAIPVQHIEQGAYSIEVCSNNECQVMAFTK